MLEVPDGNPSQTNDELQTADQDHSSLEGATLHDPDLDESMSQTLSISTKPVVGMLFNPISGYAKAAKIATETSAELARRGYEVRLRTSEAKYDQQEIENFLRTVDYVVVAGGDGTVSGILPHLANTGVPMYMLPAGNESLVARNFDMTTSVDLLVDRMEKHQPSEHYFGCVDTADGSVPFLLMASIGLDSKVISEISKHRTGPIGHIGYVKPAIDAIVKYEAPKITLSVDGEQKLIDQPGYLIIANSSEYALRINLVPEANTRSDELAARFFPGEKMGKYLPWLQALLTGQPINPKGSEFFSGKKFEISVAGDSDYEIQADGDSVGSTPAVIKVDPRMISVLDD